MISHALLTAPIGPTIARMAAPNVIAMLMMLATSGAEAWYAGQIGVSALAGLALAFPMFMLMAMVSAGAIGGAIAGAVAQALGAGSTRDADAIAWHAVVIALGFGVIFAAVFLVFGEQVFALLGGKAAALSQAVAYADVLFAGCFLFWLANILSSVVRGAGQMRFAAFSLIAGSVTQVAAGAVLVLGIGPVPSFGIAGAAWAVLIGAAVANLIMLPYLASGRAGLRLRLSGVRLSLARLSDLLRPGLVASLSPISSIATISVVTALVARQGEVVLAGFGIGTRMEFLLIPIVFGIGAALITLVGVHFGAGEIERGHRVAWTGAIAAALITGSIGGVLALFPGLWADLFTDVEAVREACRTYLRIVGPFYGFFGLGLALFFASQGARRMMWPVGAGLLRLAIIAIVGGAMVSFWQVSTEQLFWLIAFGLVTYGVVMAAVVKLGAWRPAGRPIQPAAAR